VQQISGKQQRRERRAQRARGDGIHGEETPTKPEDEDDSNVEWSISTTKEAVEARRRELLGVNETLSTGSEESALKLTPGQTPIQVLQEFWKTEPNSDEILKKVKQLQNSQRWSDGTLLKIVFSSLFDKDIKKNFLKKTAILELVSCSLLLSLSLLS